MDRAAIQRRARDFAIDWADAESEQSDRQPFWDAFYGIFGLARRHVAVYEQAAVRASTGGHGWIDMLQPGEMAVEHKSRGENLDAAMDQLEDYLGRLKAADVPWLLIACDFGRFRWKNLETGESGEFALAELTDNLDLFWWIAGGDTPQEAGLPEMDVNLQATELLAALHDELRASGYPDHDMREWLTRILFCLFADDTEVWERKLFETYIESRTRDDGSDLGPQINYVFQVLNTPDADRSPNLDEELAGLTYVNGDLFERDLRTPACNETVRDALRRACRYNWGKVSPAIFGSLFQNVMQPAERRQLGAHYTTETNILRTIRPLFLDQLEAELERANTRPALDRLHDKIASCKFLDPACGCGNFLVIAYREMRRIELEILRKRLTVGRARQRHEALQLETSLDFLCRVTVDQFYGIEIEEFPALIARTALYLSDHLANREVSAEFGQHYVRFPIPASPHVAIGNAARMDWNDLLPAEQASFVFGNPPFGGRQYRNAEQQEDMRIAHRGVRGHGVLDYVTCWFVLAADYIEGTEARCAFVATNSISQGENVSALWPGLLAKGVHIDFAHRTFEWTSEARGAANVHVVIVGFSRTPTRHRCRLFVYPEYDANPEERSVSAISPYLNEGPPLVVRTSRSMLTQGIPDALYGSMVNDGGHLLFDESDIDAARADPVAAAHLRPYVGGTELLNGTERWALWLADASPSTLRSSAFVRGRLQAVQEYRSRSRRAATVAAAATPHLFTEPRDVGTNFLLVPYVSSERRPIVPMAFFDKEVLVRAPSWCIPGADLWLFGVLQSAMYNSWLQTIAGRLESRLTLSPGTIYNTFPFPERRNAQPVEEAAQAVLDARDAYPNETLGDLYDSLLMPSPLVAAHRDLDRVIDQEFQLRRRSPSDADRLAHLLGRYEQMTAPLTASKSQRRRR